VLGHALYLKAIHGGMTKTYTIDTQKLARLLRGGRVIYLEGSYVNTFSGNPHPTPYYEYNQIMYRLDLADARLNLPAASSGP
jgi:hypothetical protein